MAKRLRFLFAVAGLAVVSAALLGAGCDDGEDEVSSNSTVDGGAPDPRDGSFTVRDVRFTDLRLVINPKMR